MGAAIIGAGKALPSLTIKNDDLQNLVDTNDEWISTRTGIKSRHISVKQSQLDLAYSSAMAALGQDLSNIRSDIETKGWVEDPIDISSIDLVIVATITADTIVPSSAAELRRVLGAEKAIAFDVNAACSGFIYATSVAESMMAASHVSSSNSAKALPVNRALVVCAERLTRLTDWQDRNTCVLFGDGAGAVVLEWQDSDTGILACYLKNDDDTDTSLCVPQVYDSIMPFSEDGIIFDEEKKAKHDLLFPDPKNVDYSYIHSLGIDGDTAIDEIDKFLGIIDDRKEGKPRQVIKMDGQRIFKFAGRTMPHAIEEACNMAGINLSDVNIIVPHQANERILKFAAKRLDIPMEKLQVSLADVGNTSSASVPMALTDAYVDGHINKGDYVVAVAFGGGLTSGAIAFKA